MSPKFAVGVLVAIAIALFVVNKGVVFGNEFQSGHGVRIVDKMPYQSISHQVQMRIDRHGTLDIHTITNDIFQSQFSRLGTPTINLGYSDAVYWFKVLLVNTQENPADVILDIPFPVLDEVEGYLVTTTEGRYQVIKEFFVGDTLPYHHRPLLSPSLVQPLTIPPAPTWLYLRVKTASPVHVPLYMADDQSYAEYVTIKQWMSGILYGIAIALACYNLMLFSALRDKTYVYYAMFIVSLFLFYACADGYAYWLWPENIDWQRKAHLYFIYLSLALAIEFSRLFLSINENHKVFMQHTRTLIGICVACILVTPFLKEVYAATLMSVVSGVGLVYMLCVGVLRLREGVPMAGLYVIVWGLLILTAFMNVLASHGLVFDFIDVNGYMKLVSVFELLLLSFGVGSKLNTIREKQARAERHALHFSEEARRAEKRALEAERESNRNLEEKVRLRTKLLEDALEELSHANSELKRLSETDALTGLYNRRKFEECFNEKIVYSHKEQAMVCFMFLDIDHFKKLNDKYGHDMGDLCLQKVAFCLADLSEKFGFVVARFGGEEFAVTTVVSSYERAAQLAEIIRAEIEKIRIPEQEDIHVTVSVGCHTQRTPSVMERSELMKKADVALYRAKAKGRNCVVSEQFKMDSPDIKAVGSIITPKRSG